MQFGPAGAIGGVDFLLRQVLSGLATTVPSSPLEAARQIQWFLPLAHQLKNELFTQVVAAPSPAADPRRLALLAQVLPMVNRRIEVLLRSVGRSRRARREANLALRLAEQIHRDQEIALSRAARIDPAAAQAPEVWTQLVTTAAAAPIMHSRLESLASSAAQLVLRSYAWS